MDCIKAKVNEEIARGNIGSNKSCPYHPTHFEGQNCSFCYCPFYPCMKEFLGKSIMNRKTGKTVWDCSDCTFIHDNDVVEFIYQKFGEMGIKDAEDSRIPEVLETAVSTFVALLKSYLHRAICVQTVYSEQIVAYHPDSDGIFP